MFEHREYVRRSVAVSTRVYCQWLQTVIAIMICGFVIEGGATELVVVPATLFLSKLSKLFYSTA